MSYDSTLPSNRDWVRFLIQDTDTTAHLITDDEIDAVLADQIATGEATKYYAAADCLSVLLAKWMGAGRGVVEKMVSKLRIEYGADTSATEALQAQIADFRRRGADRTVPSTESRILMVS